MNVNVRARGGWTAEPALDFDEVTSTLQLGGPYPQTGEFIVPVRGDANREAHEKFYALIADADSIEWPGQHQPFAFDLERHAAVGKIINDDEGAYTEAKNIVAVYHGADPGGVVNGVPIAAGANFRAAGEHYGTSASFDVTSWANALSQLETWVAANGRIHILYMFDHGTDLGGRQMGDEQVPYNGYESLAPLLNDNGYLIHGGCHVALARAVDGGTYGDFIADDGGPGLTVRSATDCVRYNADGTISGSFVSFHGIAAPPPGVTP